MPAPAPRRLDSAAGTVYIYDEPGPACRDAADQIVACIHRAVAARGRANLGLATGGTPIPVYRRLVDRHRAGECSFAPVHTFNLDEFYPMSPCDPQSYRAYMHQRLFAPVDLPANQAHVLDGTVPEAAVAEHCAQFDRWIAEAGGLDLQLLGIGRNGHIGFNEPSELSVAEALALPTRRVPLHPMTTADAARDFGSTESVPLTALTVGVAPILAARTILVLAFGARKAEAVAGSLRGPITAACPGSLLQTVADRVVWLLDEPAAAGL